ncbi:MAG: T9SS type A sorting domain-containing protein [Bacteroidota bacterium]
MKKLFTLIYLITAFSAKADSWTQKATFAGPNRIGCFSFSIGTKGYFGCGYDTTWGVTQKFWEYNQQTNSWTQKADYPDSARIYATGFSIANYGYAGIGVSPAGGWMTDFWKYDPGANTWSSIDSFPGGGRSEACSFVINNKAYVGTGTGSVAPYIFNDLWEYDPLTNAWTSKASFPGLPRTKAIGFADVNYGYIVTGSASGIYFSDMYQYNPVTDSWIPKTNFTGDPRAGAAGFSLYNKLYLGTGLNHSATGTSYASNDWWQYNPDSNQWKQIIIFPSYPRYETGYFTINNKGYVGTGVKINVQYSDFWEYTPNAPNAIDEGASAPGGLQFTITPNPVKEMLIINYPFLENKNSAIVIKDLRGKIVYSLPQETRITNHETKINISGLSQGIYLVELSGEKEKTVKKFMKE